MADEKPYQNEPPPRRALKLRSRRQAPSPYAKPPLTLLKTWLALLDNEEEVVRESATRNIGYYFSSIDDAKEFVSKAK